jgi:hypothetical protein
VNRAPVSAAPMNIAPMNIAPMNIAPMNIASTNIAPMNTGALTCQALLNCRVREVSIPERQTSAVASAPANARAWTLAEHPGPWPEEAIDAHLPGPLRKVIDRADELGVRVQLIRRPGRRNRLATPAVFVGWTTGPRPWLRGGDLTDVDARTTARWRAPRPKPRSAPTGAARWPWTVTAAGPASPRTSSAATTWP